MRMHLASVLPPLAPLAPEGRGRGRGSAAAAELAAPPPGCRHPPLKGEGSWGTAAIPKIGGIG